jgi:hypothetical protein
MNESSFRIPTLARMLGVTWVVLGCLSCGTGRDAGPASGAGEARQEIYLVDHAREAGLDIVQVGGDPLADYILDTIGTGGAWLDYDDDGDADFYMAQGSDGPGEGPPDVLYRNDGIVAPSRVPRFTNVTEQAGLGDRLWTFGVAVADYDDDGDPDIYLANWGPNRLYSNNGDGTFSEVAAAAGVDDPGWGVSAAWNDVDLDGDLDLYVTCYVEFAYGRYPKRGEPGRAGEPPCRWRNVEILCGPRNLEPGVDVFYRNDGDTDGDGVPNFTNATDEAGLRTSQEYYGLGVLFFDSNNDGYGDLYVANDSVINTYFVNRGDGTFQEMGLLSGLAYNEQGHEQAGMGVAAADYNGDDRLDLAVTNFSHDHHTLYRNDGGHTFTDASFPAGLGGTTYVELGWGVVWADLDHDGWEDLYMAHGHTYPQVDDRDTGTTFNQRNIVFRHMRTDRFENITERAGPGLELIKCSRSALPADIDQDGDLDILVTNLNDTPDLLINEAGAGHWLQVRLRGTRSNSDAIGARVTIQADGRRQTREITRTASFAGSMQPVAHFGLGSSNHLEWLEVRWPSGAKTRLEDLGLDQLLVLVEPDDG